MPGCVNPRKTCLVSAPRGAAALPGDAHAEALEAALGVALRQVEEAGLALVAQSARHVVLDKRKFKPHELSLSPAISDISA